MKNYRIAYFTADWNYELVETTLHGLKRFTEDHENVSLCIFDCFGKDIGNNADMCEYAIFQLPDLATFDGLLIQGNQIVLQSVREEIVKKILATGIPAVSIDCPLEGCTLVGVDNEAAQHDMTLHVIRDHGAKRLVYLTGILNNGCPEAIQRRDGFLRACREQGVAGSDVEIIEGSWRASDGANVVRRWIESGRPLPDAFICANDDMALGMTEALRDLGRRVPDDVIVTGFDGLTSAAIASPSLSTISRDCAGLNYRAMELLIQKIDGERVPDSIPFDYSVVCAESCGCAKGERHSYLRDRYFQQNRFLKNFYIAQDRMAEQLFDVPNLLSLMDIVEKNRSIFGCDNVWLCINERYFDSSERSRWGSEAEPFCRNMIVAPCGRPDFDFCDTPYVRFPTLGLLPEALMRKYRFLVFYPLHYNTYSIGYLVLDGISEAAELNLHRSIFNFLEIAIENVRKKDLLHELNKELDDLYIHDALTQLYNRFGYERYAREVYNGFRVEDGGAQILFIDMDDMKGINDRYGHEAGDAAIRATAEVLKRACDEKDFIMRYGGDEFLIIASCRKPGLENAIYRELARYNANSDAPFQLNLSIGVVRVNDAEGDALDDAVQSADALMYTHKRSRGRRKGE